MTEAEYIDATNLAKLRQANRIIRDCLPMNDSEKALERDALRAILQWTDVLEARVRCVTVDGGK